MTARSLKLKTILSIYFNLILNRTEVINLMICTCCVNKNAYKNGFIFQHLLFKNNF